MLITKLLLAYILPISYLEIHKVKMKCIVFYIANAAQLAGIFGMIYVQIKHKPAKISTKPRVTYIADKQWTINLCCDSKAPENYCVLSYSFLSLVHSFLKYTLLNGHWFLLAVLQKATEKLHAVCKFALFYCCFYLYQNMVHAWGPKYGAGGLQPESLPRAPLAVICWTPLQAEKATHCSLSLLLWLIVV